MRVVSLVSGGIDSALMSLLIRDAGHEQLPLFVNYGQQAFTEEWKACRLHHKKFGLPVPEHAELPDYGRLIPSGLTCPDKDIVRDAFLPGRNMLFILVGASYARSVGADAVAIGLLNEKTHLFPDQTIAFLRSAEKTIAAAIDGEIGIMTPLIDFFKADVVALAAEYGIQCTYSCHKGGKSPCGQCIACKEFPKKGGNNGRKRRRL